MLSVAALAVLAIGLLLGGGAGDVEAHLDELVPAGRRLFALSVGRRSVVAILWQRHLHGDFIATSQVGVANLGVRKLKRRPVLDVEGDFGLLKLGLAPVPAAQGVLLALEDGAVPVLEDLAQAIIVLLLEAVELENARVALEDANLVALGDLAPLRAANVVVIERKSVATAVWLPAEASLCESASAALLGEVEVDAVKALTVGLSVFLDIFVHRIAARDMHHDVSLLKSRRNGGGWQRLLRRLTWQSSWASRGDSSRFFA